MEKTPLTRKTFEDSESTLRPNITTLLRALYRRSPIKGMEGQHEPDPIAQDLLVAGQANIDEVEQYLVGQGITHLEPLKGGYGFESVVFDAGDRVARLSRHRLPDKPDAPYVLQPLASEKIGKILVTINKKLVTSGISDDDVRRIQDDLNQQGWYWDDSGTDNLARDETGQFWIIDGSVKRKSK